jgi:hypothetical protein
MAADVTLIAMPATEENLWVMRHRLYLDLFADDEVCIEVPHGTGDADTEYLWLSGADYLLRDDSPEIAFYSSGAEHTARHAFDREFYANRDARGKLRWDSFEVGPWSTLKASLDGSDRWIPGPTHAIFNRFVEGGILTHGKIAATMVAYNLPDHSHYKSWSRHYNHTSRGGVRISRLGSNRGKRCAYRGERRWAYHRTPSARMTRRWLVSHLGHLVWAESW